MPLRMNLIFSLNKKKPLGKHWKCFTRQIILHNIQTRTNKQVQLYSGIAPLLFTTHFTICLSHVTYKEAYEVGTKVSYWNEQTSKY